MGKYTPDPEATEALRLMTIPAGEIAKQLMIDPNTVTNWRNKGVPEKRAAEVMELYHLGATTVSACTYNSGVDCLDAGRDEFCARCGWNPEVARKRREKRLKGDKK